jgi:hypothetical protein
MIVDGADEGIVSIIEDHLLESISSTEWHPRDTSHDFSYVTEDYNQFIANLPSDDIRDIHIVLAMLMGEELTLSTIGRGHGVFVESEGDLTDISIHEWVGHTFHSITTGKIPSGSSIYLSNDAIESLLGAEVLDELAHLSPEAWTETSRQILEREVASSLHIIRLSHRTYEATPPLFSRNKKKQSDILRDQWILFIEYIRSQKMWERTKGIIRKLPVLENKKYQYVFLSAGIAILFALSYILISSIVSVLSTPASDSKNLLIQASLLVDEGQRLSGNPAVFNVKIAEAEKILFAMRKEETHMVDIQKLLGRIASMKKEVYDIQTIDMTHLSSIIPFDPTLLSPLGVYEKDKKLTLIGEQWAIIGYTTSDKTTKVVSYPRNERIKSMDSGEDGSAYLLTAENHVLVPRRDEFAYINVTGQPGGWEDALSLKTFNGNIYLLDSSKNQIQRHKPGVNGFSQKSGLLPKVAPGIFDMSVDGGVYLYMDDGRIQRYLGDKENISSITLNKVPGEWLLDTTKKSVFITRSFLSYTYILNGDRIWIFQPNSRRFQDITAWTYIGQFELKTEATIKSIYIPRDGVIYVTTSLGVYQLNFEFIDGKILFK